MSQSAFVLILDPEARTGDALRDLLRDERGFPCRLVESSELAIESLEQRTPDVVVIRPRVGSDSNDGIALLLAEIKRHASDASVVFVGEPPISASRKPASISTLPVDEENAKIADKVEQVAAKAVARREDRLLKESLERHPYEVFDGIVGESPAIRRIIDRIKKVANKGKLTVLILGETGTGKDLIAEAIHHRSTRARKPFVPVNCAAFSESLLESQLFGHIKGAFTGAVADQKGVFAAADGGTIFLDEIGDMPQHLQAKLLRVLERREITPLGSSEIRRVDVRIIAATNMDLAKKVESKEFRADLYYRLHQWEIRVPPLRERRQDVPLLAHHFLAHANESLETSVPGISSDALQALMRYLWPGNVRELKNLVESVAAEVENRQIELADLPERVRGSRELATVGPTSLVGITLAQAERLLIENALRYCNENREQAAKMLGIGTRTLYRKIKEFGL